MNILFLLYLTLASCLIELDVTCKQTALKFLKYLAVTWTPLLDYESLDLRVCQEWSTNFGAEAEEMTGTTILKRLASEYHFGNSTSAALPFSTPHEGPLEASLWGLVAGGWILVSRIEVVSSCREYRQ